MDLVKNPTSLIKAQRGIKNILLPFKQENDETDTDNDYISTCANDSICIRYDVDTERTEIVVNGDIYESDRSVRELHDLINSQFLEG